MPKVRLDGASFLTIRGKLEAAAVTQHVAVDQKAKPVGLERPEAAKTIQISAAH
jgi:hypothetical protein